MHRRLGHPSSQHLSYVISTSSNSKIKKELDSCDVCFRAKQTRTVFPLSENKEDDLFGLIHCDLWGPYTKSASSGAHYFLTIVDDHSRAVWIYLIKEKSEVPGCLRHFSWCTHNKVVKIDLIMVRSQRLPCFHFLRKKGILFQTSCVGTPQQKC